MGAQTQYDHAAKAVRSQLVPVFVFSFVANLLLLVTSIYMMQVFDRVLTSGSLPTLFWLTVIAFVGLGAYALLEIARKSVLTETGLWFEAQLAVPLLSRLVRTNLSGQPPRTSLDDVADIKRFLSGDGILAFLDAPWMPLFLLVIWSMNPLLGALAVGGAIALFLIALLNSLMTRHASAQQSAHARENHSDAQRILDQAETVTSLGMVDGLLRRWQSIQAKAHTANRRSSDAVSLFTNLSKFVRLGLQVGILGTGAFLVLDGQLTAGGMIAASIILSRALSPVERSLTAWRTMTSARAARGRLSRFFCDTPEKTYTRLPECRGFVEVQAAGYAPTGAPNVLLRNISFSALPGQTIAVVGPSGSGKSTLCRLLVGTCTPQAGHIRLDGASLDDWDPEQLTKNIGYLPQGVVFFSGTVARNISRMREASDEDVIAAAKLADCHDLILGLPDGYQTDIGMFGHRLSGGQRQRIGLARALFRDPKLIVLDEPNASLDSDGEQTLVHTLEALRAQDKTIVIVAHQASMLRTADAILILKNGRVIAFGPREDLVRKLLPEAKNRVLPLSADRKPPTEDGDLAPASGTQGA